jgi:ATP synthase protein I
MSGSDRNEDDDAALRARLDRLQELLLKREEERRAEATREPTKGGPFGRAMSLGLTVFSEFVAAIVVGAFLGWQADAWLGTKPWLLVLFMGLGTAAGFWNVYRVATRKPPSNDADAG